MIFINRESAGSCVSSFLLTLTTIIIIMITLKYHETDRQTDIKRNNLKVNQRE